MRERERERETADEGDDEDDAGIQIDRQTKKELAREKIALMSSYSWHGMV